MELSKEFVQNQGIAVCDISGKREKCCQVKSCICSWKKNVWAGGTEFLPILPFLTPYLQVSLWKVARVWERTDHSMHEALRLRLLFLRFKKKKYINASLGKYSVFPYSSRLQGLTCLAHSSERKVLNLMLSSLAVVGIHHSSRLHCPAFVHSVHILPLPQGYSSTLHSWLLSLPPKS